MHRIIKRVDPKVVGMDPITTFIGGKDGAVKSMLTRLVDFLKMQQITALFTNLSTAGGRLESTDENVSSIMDAWLLLRDVEDEGRRSCALYVLKARGMAHSREMRDFLLTDDGIRLGENYMKGLNSANRPPATKSAAFGSGGDDSGRKH
jgi:circadian clock protein KaiC